MGSIGRPRASKPMRSLPMATQAPHAPGNTRWARSPRMSGLPARTGLLPQHTIRCAIPGTLRKRTHGHPRHARRSHSPDDTGKRADWQAETPCCCFGWRAYSCCDWPRAPWRVCCSTRRRAPRLSVRSPVKGYRRNQPLAKSLRVGPGSVSYPRLQTALDGLQIQTSCRNGPRLGAEAPMKAVTVGRT